MRWLNYGLPVIFAILFFCSQWLSICVYQSLAARAKAKRVALKAEVAVLKADKDSLTTALAKQIKWTQEAQARADDLCPECNTKREQPK